MKKLFASKEINGFFLSILFLLIGMTVIWATKAMLITVGDAVFVSLFLIPILVYVIVSGKISEFKAPGGIEAKFVTMANQPAEELASQRVEFVEEELIPVTKDSVQELDRLERLVDPSKRIILKLMLGQASYNRQDAETYLERFLRFYNFNHVVFLDKKHKFVAFIPPWAMLRILQGDQGNRFIDIINQGNIELLDFPGVMSKTISTQATYLDALQAMAEQHLETILVVDQDRMLKGVVDREQVLSKLMLAMAK